MTDGAVVRKVWVCLYLEQVQVLALMREQDGVSEAEMVRRCIDAEAQRRGLMRPSDGFAMRTGWVRLDLLQDVVAAIAGGDGEAGNAPATDL